MSSEKLSKLEIKRRKLELNIQKLNAELELKEIDYIELINEINKIKSTNLGVLN